MTASIKENILEIENARLSKAAMVIRALNHKLRREIIQLIHSKGRVTVTEVYVKLRLEQSVTSQHLGILRHANILITEREGRFIFYSVNYQRIKEIQAIAETMVKH